MNINPKALAEQVRSFIAGRRDTRADLLRRKAAIETRREELLSLPLSRDDAKQFIFDYIDARAAEYPSLAGWPSLFESIAYPRRNDWLSAASINPATGKRAPLCLRDIDRALFGTPSEHGATFEDGLRFFGTGSAVNLRSDYAAYFFFGDTIKERIGAHFEDFFPGYCATDEKRVGPPVQERRAELARLMLEEGELIAALARIDAELSELKPEAEPAQGATAKPTTSGKVEAASVSEDVILRYNGRNENELAKECGVPASAIIAAFYQAEAKRRDAMFRAVA